MTEIEFTPPLCINCEHPKPAVRDNMCGRAVTLNTGKVVPCRCDWCVPDSTDLYMPVECLDAVKHVMPDGAVLIIPKEVQ